MTSNLLDPLHLKTGVSGLTFSDFKFADDVTWIFAGRVYEGWVMGWPKI